MESAATLDICVRLHDETEATYLVSQNEDTSLSSDQLVWLPKSLVTLSEDPLTCSLHRNRILTLPAWLAVENNMNWIVE